MMYMKVVSKKEARYGILGLKVQSLTKLEVRMIGTDVVAGTQYAFHDQSVSHRVEESEMARDTVFLKRSNLETRRTQMESGITVSKTSFSFRCRLCFHCLKSKA